MSAARWRFAPYFMVRQCGFAFARLEILRDPDVSAAIVEVAIANAVVSRLRRGMLLALRPVADSDRNHRRVSKYKPVDTEPTTGVGAGNTGVAWNNALDRRRDSRDRYLSAYQRCLSRYATELPALFYDDTALLDAVLLSNQASYRTIMDSLGHIDTANPGRRDRRRLDLLVMYLQRFCSKNDTNAHFGPFGVGTIAAHGGNLQHKQVPGIKRHTFISHWAADAIAAAAAADLAIDCYPRVAPGVLQLESGIFTLHYSFAPIWTAEMTGPVSLGPFEQALLTLCDGSRSVTDIATVTADSAAGDQASVQNIDAAVMHRRVRESLNDLVHRGFVDAGVDVTVGVSYPLADVASRLNTSGGDDNGRAARITDLPASRWSTRVAKFDAAIESFGAATTPVERDAAFDAANGTFEKITGESAHRRGGVIYADRSVLYEECMREDTVTIGSELLSALENELGLYMDLLLLPSRVRLAKQRDLITRWFTNAFRQAASDAPSAQTDDVPVSKYLCRWFADSEQFVDAFKKIDLDVDAVTEEIHDLLLAGHRKAAAECSEDVVCGSIDIAATSVKKFLAERQPAIPALCNPDVMIIGASVEAINKGRFALVAGDCHAVRDALTHTSVSTLIEQREPRFVPGVRDAYAAVLAPDEVLVDLVRDHDEKTGASVVVADVDLELGGRSRLPRSQVVSMRDLSVRKVGNGLRMYCARLGTFVVLAAPPIGGLTAKSDPLAVFSFPRHHQGTVLGDCPDRHLPRVVCGPVTFNRERWRIEVASILAFVPDGPPVRDEDDHDGILRMSLFRRHEGMPQQVFVSVPGEDKPIFVDFDSPGLVRQLWRLLRGSSRGAASFSEMLPGPDQLWLHNERGVVSSELRMTAFSDGRVNAPAVREQRGGA